MKFTIFLFLFLINFAAFAEVEIPEYLKGATYTVTLKNGKQYLFSSDQFKLVDRKPKKPVAAPKPKEIIKEVEVVVKEPVYKPFSVGVYLGRGPAKLDFSEQAEDAEVTEKKNVVAGLSLGYQFDLDWMLRASVLSNDTWLLGADWKFGKIKN